MSIRPIVVAALAILVVVHFAGAASGEEPFGDGEKPGMEIGRDDPGMGKLAARALASLLVVIAVAWLSLVVGRRLAGRRGLGSSGRGVRVIETTHLGGKRSLHLVQVGTRTYLLGSGAEEVRLLAEVTDAGIEPPDEGADAGGKGSFRSVLRQLIPGRAETRMGEES